MYLTLDSAMGDEVDLEWGFEVSRPNSLIRRWNCLLKGLPCIIN